MVPTRWLLALTCAGWAAALAAAAGGCRTPSPASWPSSSAVPTTTPPRVTDGSIRCGASTCAAGSQVCCHDLTTPGAACAQARGRIEPDQPYPPQECFPYEVLGHVAVRAECDDSSDCPAGEACCADDYLGFHCRPSPCPRFEACVVGFPCGSSGRCVASADDDPLYSACVDASAGVMCGREPCPADRPICCAQGEEGRRCVRSPADCRVAPPSAQLPLGGFEPSYACDEPGDCPAGTGCCASRGAFRCSSACAPNQPPGDLRVVCRSGGDCPAPPAGKTVECIDFRLIDPTMQAPSRWFCQYDDDEATTEP